MRSAKPHWAHRSAYCRVWENATYPAFLTALLTERILAVRKEQNVQARIIHELGGDNGKLFREERLWLFFPKHLAIVTRSVSEETPGTSSLTRRVTKNPG